MRGQAGFTLVELLVVIAVLGVLSGVVVVGVGAFRDDASTAACEADARTITTAQQAALATTGSYVTEDELVSIGLLSSTSNLHDVVLGDGGFSVVPVGDCAGDGEELAEGTEDLGEEVAAEEQLTEEDAAKKAADEEAAAQQAADEEAAKKAAEEDAAKKAAEEAAAGAGGCTKGQIDINSASKKQLREIDHVGGDEAERIEKQRPFTSLAQLVEVKGLDDKDVRDIISEGKACVGAGDPGEPVRPRWRVR